MPASDLRAKNDLKPYKNMWENPMLKDLLLTEDGALLYM